MPVNPQASQANDAGKADHISPFDLLMATTTPKEERPARAQDPVEKPGNDQAAASAQSAKPQARPESKSESRSESKPKAKPEEKSKPDENKTADNDSQDKQEEVAVANDNSAPAPVDEPKPVAANPVPPPQPIVPLIVIADAGEETPASETPVQESATPVAAAAPSQLVTPPVQDLAALTAARVAANGAASQPKPATEAQAGPQPQPQQAAASQAPAAQTPTQQTQAEQASALQPPVSATPQETPDPQPATPQPIVQPVGEQQTDTVQSVRTAPAKETLVQIATLQNPPSAKPAEAGERTDSAAPAGADLKTDAAKAVTHEHPAQSAESKDVKADVPRPEIVKADPPKPDTAQPATVETAALKSTPQVQTPPGTNIASVQTGPVTQPGATPAVLPGIPQHVQVSAQAPAPNMPALAVEIAAKSQSGAKQFDIRLDPPELGRVEVRLSIDAAGKASAHLSADQPQTLDLLQKDASSLTRALREAGLNVSQDGLNFSLRQQNHDGSGAQGQGRNASRGVNLIATTSIEATQNGAGWRGDGRLDIRV